MNSLLQTRIAPPLRAETQKRQIAVCRNEGTLKLTWIILVKSLKYWFGLSHQGTTPGMLLGAALCLALATLALAGETPAHSTSFAVADLHCEDLVDPLGIETATPRFSWRMVSDARGAAQGAYQVLCATKPGLLEMLDSKGETTTLVTDETWRAKAGSRAYRGGWSWNNFGGEVHNGSEDQPDWADADLDDSGWPGARPAGSVR